MVPLYKAGAIVVMIGLVQWFRLQLVTCCDTQNILPDIGIFGELHLRGAFPKVNIETSPTGISNSEGKILHGYVMVLPVMDNLQIRHGTDDPLNLIKMSIVAELGPRRGDGHGRVSPECGNCHNRCCYCPNKEALNRWLHGK